MQHKQIKHNKPDTSHSGIDQEQARQLALLQEQLHIIFTASSDGIALVDASRRFIEINPAFAHIFGVDAAQLVGADCLQLFHSEENNAHEADNQHRNTCAIQAIRAIQQALEQQQALPYLEVDLTINGLSHAIGLTITPLVTAIQPRSVITVRDVTAMRDAARMKANFLSMITHEFRSPINAMHGYLDLALTGMAGELNAQQREFVQRARSSSEHLYALIEDILLISRADSGQIRLNRALVSLQEIVANAVEELELMAIDHDITINVEVPQDFPPIYADPVRMQQVLRNLISNALRFTSSGGIVTIAASITHLPHSNASGALSVAEGNRLLKLDVIDTGHGIAQEQQQRIFERFYQVSQAAFGRSSGMGLGLAIVKMIVELHGGQVSVSSTPEEGSTFTCLLPCLLS
ncbi:MAG TPA: ATP-binding protein [Ktedonobacteraceae bacterium]